MDRNPEIANRVTIKGITTNYHDQGSGFPVTLLHGSGAGVTAWANWRGAIPELATNRRVIAPDLVGFGYTDAPADIEFRLMDTWVEQIIGLLDALDIERTDLIGNSFGGTLSLALAIRHPKRFRRIVLMGSGGQPFEFTPELDALWGYTPSLDNMKRILDIMAFDRSIVTDELAEMRYRATARPGVQERFEKVFPPPRQRWVDAQVMADEDLAALPHEVLVIHGRDDRVVPLDVSLRLAAKIDRAQLHVFGRCGHWTQIEHGARFLQLVKNFLDEAE
ncbi:alpha/beta fold hydrolase [Aromatoleum toluolicum]|uniref:Alpha/beta fold hydrolase n=1 Tax=Aromatoleum toluolicum TaxID=90060 RepID=A0ABX1NCE8_9RHOO|nr:alpha/beta fold hydrolase [Aromatoleum toluolicum]NMF96956.1 alpha/beta fold hydrolase [Aromatoleum toluolicum]